MSSQRRAAEPGGSGPARRPAQSAGLRKEMARRARTAQSDGQRAAPRRRVDPRDAHLPPHDRGPVRAFVRDAVDGRRRLVGLFLPVLGVLIISIFGPSSDLQRYMLYGSLAAMALVLADAVRMGVQVTRAARAAFPDEPVPGFATGWYAFLRAHRTRALRRPPPRVTPGGRGPR
ncbi:MAG: DUF3043 domain-containing protein [Blastococcus sp.]